MKLSEWIEAQGITATFDRVSAPQGASRFADWGRGARYFMVTLQRREGGPGFRTPYNIGSAITDNHLTAESVLDCLASDFAGLDNSGHSYSEWCSEYGFDPSTKHRQMFNALEKQYDKFKAWLGDNNAFNALLYDTDRG